MDFPCQLLTVSSALYFAVRLIFQSHFPLLLQERRHSDRRLLLGPLARFYRPIERLQLISPPANVDELTPPIIGLLDTCIKDN